MKEEFDDLEPTIIEGHEDKIDEEGVLDDKTRIVKKTTPAFAWLVCISKQFNGKRFDVNTGITTIGRGSENDIIVGDDSVSKDHAKIKYSENDDKYKIYDLVSTNGTFVNEVKVEAPIELKDGDTVTIGEIDFIFKRVEIKKTKRQRMMETETEEKEESNEKKENEGK